MLVTLVLFLFLPLPAQVISTSKWICGGNLTSKQGYIMSPNFPQKFLTPIHCEWRIDLSNRLELSGRSNLTIKFYFTQLYVQEGLKFIAYDSKDTYDYLKDRATVITLNEDHVTNNTTFIVVDAGFVIVDFRLEQIESTHLRVLDGLLDVYGFNITYEISRGPPREDRCSMKLCGFTGFCYDDFKHFRCDCFPGFQGRTCSKGPKSKCFDNGQPACENGAECLHIGHTAFVCDCKPGFEGTFCNQRISKVANATECSSNNPNCLISCKFNGTMEDVCRCNGKTNKYIRSINESVGYSSRIFVQSKLNELELRETLKRNMLETLNPNITKIQDINIMLTSMANNETDVTLRFYAPKSVDELVRSTIRKWGRQQYGRTDKGYTLTEKDILVKSEPCLYLENIAIDKTGVISQGEEFVLSCTARGSKFMIFRWFMDGMLVNLTRANKNIWEKLIPKDRSNSDHYTALLVVRSSTRFDSGRFTCHVEDYGFQQCRSLQVEMNYQPLIKLEPASLTVDKAQPFTIKCMSLAKYGEKYKFSWTKDKSLLPIRTEHEHYEILYPGGSILQVSGLNKSTSYSCLAHLDKLSTESTILVNVVDKQVIRPCHSEYLEGFSWPETAPGGECRQECLDDYFGSATRSCIMLENGGPRWLLPDYSNCTQFQLMESLSDFRYLEAGYARTTPLETLIHISDYLRNTGRRLLRGEGSAILHLVERVTTFNNASDGYSDHTSVTDAMLEILDGILAQNVSLNKEQQVVALQRLVCNQLKILSAHINKPYKKLLNNLQVYIEIDNNYVNPSRVIRIDYKNLYEFLTKKSIIRLNYGDDLEMQYELPTGVTSIWRWPNTIENEQSNKVSTMFHHHWREIGSDSTQLNTNRIIKCVLAKFAASDYVWNAYQCHIVYENETSILCECAEEGTMAILLIDDIQGKHNDFKMVPREDIVLVGCALCFATCAFTGILLILSWCRHKSTMTFLKAQCALSITVGMVLFLLGFSETISKRFYLNALSGLLISYLMALSSQLSTLLIIYTDLIEMQQITSIKPTVVGIITGAPVIAVFTNHLTHNIKDISLQHWWIVKDTLSFYIFLVCISVVLILYVILWCLVSKLLKTDNMKGDKVFSNRSTMMTKSTLIFVIVTISAGVSVGCVNHPEDIIWQYAFAVTSIFMGLLIMVCLVFRVQTFTKNYLLDKLHRRTPDGKDLKGKPREHHISYNKSDKQMMESDHSPEIEEYNASPTQYSASGNSGTVCTSNSLNSPDILGTKVFAELDLVASSLQSGSGSGFDNNSPNIQNNSINNVANIDKNIEKTLSHATKMLTIGDMVNIDTSPSSKLPKLNRTDKSVTFCDKVEYDTSARVKLIQSQLSDNNVEISKDIVNTSTTITTKDENEGSAPNLDEVLDGISNDLKYLLNGHQFVDPINTISC